MPCPHSPLVIGHRGASGHELENTLAAFRRASLMGADGVELDVHATADGEIIVHHDADIEGRPVRGLTLEEIREHPLANGEKIPTLAQALEVIEGIAYVEVKALDESADEELFGVIDGRRNPGEQSPDFPTSRPPHFPTHIHSFEHALIRRLQAKRPDLTYGVLSMAVPVHPQNAWADANAAEVWQSEELISKEFVALAHSEACLVFAWTVDDPERMLALRDMGVDGICTNKPDVGVKCLK